MKFLLVLTIFALNTTAIADEYCSDGDLNKMIGQTIYIGQGKGLSDRLVTNSGSEIFLGRYEPVTVLSASEEAPHRSIQWSESYYISVKRSNGETGWYPCRLDIIAFNNPIPLNWSNKVITLIHNRKAMIGMTKEQATMAWGKPKRVSSNISAGEVSEQWIYGIGNYLYFIGNKLTNIQTSRE